MADLVLGKAFELLCGGIQDLIVNNFLFKSPLHDAKSRLDKLEPLIKKLAHYNEVMDGQDQKELEELKGVLEKGQELVDKCSTITRWSPFKKYKYARKILEWEDSLKSPLESVKLQEAMNVMDMRMDVQSLMRKRQKTGESSNCSTPLELPPLPKLVVGLDGPLKDLKEKLLCDDGESMLVLAAPGGCGKTTLATMFCQDEEVKGKFKNNIVFITVSQNGSLELVVKRLYEHVRSSVPDFPVPSFQNEVLVFQWMETFRKERPDPLLLVLDDIWSGSEYILESFQSERSNHKILVTSRSEFPRFSSLYQLKLLDDDNAMKLFYHSASLGDKCSRTLEGLSKKIVKRCNGFPLAITVVGRSLSGQPLEVWRKREAEWSNGSSILDSETKLFLCLQSSLNALNKEFETVKDCYLDLGSFPEDKKIRVDQLIDMWAELYDLDSDSVLANVHELVNRNLATFVDERNLEMERAGFYDYLFVTQHDLLRELAIYNAKLDPVEQRERVFLEIKENNIPKWWRREQTYRPVKARLLSITTDRNFDKHRWPEMQLPESEVFVLHFSNPEGYKLPEFVEKMEKLKVLVMDGNGSRSSGSWLGNFEVLSSLPNLRRINLTGIAFPAIKKTAQFVSVRKMSLCDCHIHCDGETWDVFPYVEEMNFDYCYFHGSSLANKLCGLIHLKVLTFTAIMFDDLPEEIGNLVNLEVLRLRDCCGVSKFPSSFKNLQKLNFLDVSDNYNVELPDCIGELSSLRKLDLRCCSGRMKLPPSVSDLTQLEEVICNEDGARLWRPFLKTLKNLRIVVSE